MFRFCWKWHFARGKKKHSEEKFLSSATFIILTCWSLPDCIFVVLSPQAGVPAKREAVVYKSSVAPSHHWFSQRFILNGPRSVVLTHRTRSLWVLAMRASPRHLCETPEAVHRFQASREAMARGNTGGGHHPKSSRREVRSCHLVVRPPCPGRTFVLVTAPWHPREDGLPSVRGWRHFSWCSWSSRRWGLNSKPWVLPRQLFF